MSTVERVDTSVGEAALHVAEPPSAPAEGPSAVLVLGHGAGGGVAAADLQVLADGLPADGVVVIRVEQPWRLQGRRVAPPPARLDRAWLEVVAVLRTRWPETPLLVGGRSAGARVACRTAHQLGADGVLALAFPLHPPGRPERSRAEELDAVGDLPLVLVQGDRDPFGRPEEFPAQRDGSLWRARGDHSLAGPGSADVVLAAARHLLGEVTGSVPSTSAG